METALEKLTSSDQGSRTTYNIERKQKTCKNSSTEKINIARQKKKVNAYIGFRPTKSQTILNLVERKEGETLHVFVHESGDLFVRSCCWSGFGVAATTDSRYALSELLFALSKLACLVVVVRPYFFLVNNNF